MQHPDQSDPEQAPTRWDPVFRHAVREVRVVLRLFAAALVWSVGCYLWLGFSDPMKPVTPPAMILGMPVWVFWSVLAPWLVIDVVAFWYCFRFMSDDDLGLAPEDREPPAASAPLSPPAEQPTGQSSVPPSAGEGRSDA